MHHMKSLSKVMNKLREEGYADDYVFEDGKLISPKGNAIPKNQLKLEDTYRFEGISNPSDMSILYQLAGTNGEKIMLIDKYGPEADRNLSKYVESVQEQ